ncbi:MAG: hypothetical protein RIM80_09195, partial [Alphaproteobacteria bacterium]
MLRSYLIAIVLAVAAVAWIASGELGFTADNSSGEPAADAAAAPGAVAEPILPAVRTRTSTASPYRQ